VQAPTGLARRRQRLSEDETADRMLGTAVAMLGRSGLTVSLDHISLEEVIRDAGVSRSAVYRRWPYKDLFFRDVVIELAKNAAPGIFDREIRLLRRVVAEREDWLNTPELRTGLVAELIRQLALLDFEVLYGSATWRTYLTLSAAFLSIADGEAREQVRAALAESEQAHIASVAAAWELLADLFGFRLRPSTEATFETLASLLDASLRGVVLAALSDPGIVAQRVRARPFGAVEEADWSLPALSFANIAWGLLEPDPAVVWDEERVATVRETARALGVDDL
jgi:AcrR family transcriptional regulator